MIFFGSKSKVAAGELVSGIKCPKCENQQFATFGIRKYFHLYWIPTFPTGKSMGMECTNCKYTMVDKELPAGVVDQISEGAFANSKSLPLYSGSIIIAVIVAFVFFAIQQDEAEEANFIAAPEVGDYYVVDYTKVFTEVDPDYRYGVMRIVDVGDGELAFRASNIAYNKASGVRDDIRNGKAASDDYYGTEPLIINADQLPDMKADGTISSIERR